ncbi:unnamed protein product [Mycena citricolor]|uniref:NADP-dependent oxidoreductase domain-containing protein n=1 Tax=Mycena citricolor TaxID=2018698 RepID=A0AAD2H6P5_9AGAR|nr:unnamed protein product [Mycena citricolor]
MREVREGSLRIFHMGGRRVRYDRMSRGITRPPIPETISLPSTSLPMALTLQSTRKLNDGNEILILGFGAFCEDRNIRAGWQGSIRCRYLGSRGEPALPSPGACFLPRQVLISQAGYRHIDSATWYENEREVGQAIRDFCESTGTPRSAIFYTTKLKLNDGYEPTLKAIQFSLDECGLEYIDLYLIHGPLGGPAARKECWRAICDAQKEGRVKSIGISTFGVRHIKEILEMGLAVPAVNQVRPVGRFFQASTDQSYEIDLHPFMIRTEIVNLCHEHGISLEAWAPLVRGLRFKHPSIVSLAKKHHKEPAQILLRYCLQKGYVAIPKSSSRARIASNTNIFDFALDEKEVADLDALDEGLVTDWDPTECP